MYPSDVIEKALNLLPDATLPLWSGADTHCSQCGHPISQGEHYSKFVAGSFFADTTDLACFSKVICWRCVHLRSQTLMFGLSRCVITEDDVFSIAKDTEKAWFFLDPPEPPFVAVHLSATLQHMTWRTPVTIDKNRLMVRFGPRLFTVRPPLMRKAIAYAKDISARSGSDWLTPMFFDRKAQSASHGKLNPKAVPFMTPAEIDFFTSLGQGELWALSYVCHSKMPVGAMPPAATNQLIEKLNAKAKTK